MQVVEKWRLIQEAPSFEISNLGNIRHMLTKAPVSVSYSQRGAKVRLRTSYGPIYRAVGKLVYEAFNPNSRVSDRQIIVYKDGDFHNNHLKNLSLGWRGRRVQCFENLKIYANAAHAAEDLGLYSKSVDRCARGFMHHTGGYSFRYL